MTKTCLKCTVEKDESEFRKKSASKDGLTPWCTTCLRAYEAEKKSSYKITRDKYRSENKEKEYAQKKIYREKNKETIRAKDKAYREKNKPREYERKILWKLANPGRSASWDAKRRTSKLQAIPKWADLSEIRNIYLKRNEIEVSTGIQHHVHHIVPLISDIVCGLHCEANLAIIPAKDNLSIGNRFWPDMP